MECWAQAKVDARVTERMGFADAWEGTYNACSETWLLRWKTSELSGQTMNVSNGNNQLPKQRVPPLATRIEENNPPIFGGVHLRAGALRHEGKSCPPFHIIDSAFNFHILRNNSARDLPQREHDPWLPLGCMLSRLCERAFVQSGSTVSRSGIRDGSSIGVMMGAALVSKLMELNRSPASRLVKCSMRASVVRCRRNVLLFRFACCLGWPPLFLSKVRVVLVHYQFCQLLWRAHRSRPHHHCSLHAAMLAQACSDLSYAEQFQSQSIAVLMCLHLIMISLMIPCLWCWRNRRSCFQHLCLSIANAHVAFLQALLPLHLLSSLSRLLKSKKHAFKLICVMNILGSRPFNPLGIPTLVSTHAGTWSARVMETSMSSGIQLEVGWWAKIKGTATRWLLPRSPRWPGLRLHYSSLPRVRSLCHYWLRKFRVEQSKHQTWLRPWSCQISRKTDGTSATVSRNRTVHPPRHESWPWTSQSRKWTKDSDLWFG